MSMNLKMSFEIRKLESNEKIASIEADSFKEAIKEFTLSYDVNYTHKYTAISDENKIDFHFNIPSSGVDKCSLSNDENNLFEIYRKNDKIYVMLSLK